METRSGNTFVEAAEGDRETPPARALQTKLLEKGVSGSLMEILIGGLPVGHLFSPASTNSLL